MTTRRTHSDRASEAWQLVYAFFFRESPAFVEVAAAYGLNPGALHALLTLDPDDPKPMGLLAESWKCDASNVTWLVDRLEEQGLAERQALAGDRRVRTVALTRKGVKTRVEIRARLDEPPDALLELTNAELDALCAIMAKVVPADTADA